MINLILGVANKVGISPLVLLAVCDVETGIRNINNYQDYRGGSYGVGQIKLGTARSINRNVDLLALQDPTTNVTLSASYLKTLLLKYKSYDLAIAAYNMGHVRYNANGELVNKEYVCNVMSKYKKHSSRLCLLRGKHDSYPLSKRRQCTNFH